MSLSTFLQIFLYLNVLLVGAVAAVAARHAYAHFRPHEHDAHAADGVKDAPNQVHLSPAAHDRLLQEAEEKFRTAISESMAKLNKELDITSEQISKTVRQMGTEMVSKELEHYRAELEKMRQQAEQDMSGVHEALAQHEQELKAEAAKQLEEEKQKLLKQIDSKLADAVTSFLLDTLQHNVDLGAQTAYLTSVLEEHKAEFSKQVAPKDTTAGDAKTEEAKA